jgi:predicted GNAT superfamily acetyltransferase
MQGEVGTTLTTADSAGKIAERAMAACGIEIRTLHSVRETKAAEALLMRVWDTGRSALPLNASTMQALAHAGNYVSGAFAVSDPEAPIGCVVGFFSPPVTRSLHSHIAAVDRSVSGGGVGLAMKLHERAWCLEKGVERMTWTFDPAVSRNAYFNIAKLGALAEEYLDDFYGSMDDGVNGGAPTDRLFVSWDLTAELPSLAARNAQGRPSGASIALAIDESGHPQVRSVDSAATAVVIEIPKDIVPFRREDPATATEWSLAIRASLEPYVTSAEWTVSTFLKEGAYIMEKMK